VEAVATKVDFSFEDSAPVRVDGFALGDRTTILAVEALTIELPEGQIRITPGGTELSDERQKLSRLENQLTSALTNIGAASVDVAVEMLDRRHAADAERKKLAAVVHELAPSGIDALETEWRNLSIRTDAAREKINGMQVPGLEEAERGLAEAKVLASRAEAYAGQARASLDASRRRETEARLSLTAETAELTAVTRELKTATDRLAIERGRLSDEATNHALIAAKTQEGMANTLLVSLNDKRTNLDPEAIKICAKSAEAALQRLGEQIVVADREISGLRGRLEGLGEKGLGETCATLEADLTLARVRLRAVEEEANAIRVLHTTLESAERDANEVFLEPVVRRVQPYLNRVLPGSRIQLGTDLTVEGLRRDGTIEPFFALSVGVREQISVITRVSFADMLADQGVHAPIILDDALVYADEQRFANTLTTLAVAASRHQLIILTCHEDRYIRLGCPIGRIECVGAVARTVKR
jgi:uncharacterized protein YhaN